MAVIEVKKQIDKFLLSRDPEIYAITGDWGVGKTYAWQKWLKEAQRGNRIGLSKYTYVSLFGINSLQDLKSSLFQNIVSTHSDSSEVSIHTFKTNIAVLKDVWGTDRDRGTNKLSWKKIKGSLKKGGRKLWAQVANVKSTITLPFFELNSDTFNLATFLSVTETIICIDDLERIGKGLDIQDVLGLVSSLVVQKKCKVLLILNEDAIKGLRDDKEYEKYKTMTEKVIDVRLKYEPTSAENIDVWLSTPDNISNLLKPDLIKLNSSNIRIISKIDRMARTLVPLLSRHESGVAARCVSILALFANCYYDRTNKYPPLDLLLDEKRFYSVMVDKGLSDQEREWIIFVQRYGYRYVTDMARVIAEMVRRGFVNEEQLQIEAEKNNDYIRAENASELLSEAWAKFTDTFDDNPEEIIQNFIDCISKYTNYISVHSLDSMIRLMREMGRDDVAETLCTIYLEKHEYKKLANYLRRDSWGDDVSDPSLKERLKHIRDTYVGDKALLEVVDKLSNQNGWDREDEIVLANASVEDYYYLFRNTKSDSLTYYIRACLKIGRIATEQLATMDNQRMKRYEKILANVTEALKQIGRESAINRMRIKRFNIELDE